MMRTTFFAGFLLLFSAAPAIARQAVLVDPTPIPLSAETAKHALEAIKQATDFPDWKTESEEPGRVLVSLIKPGYSAKIAVVYDSASIRANYFDSTGMKYEEKNGSREISPEYNRAAKEFLERVRIYLGSNDENEVIAAEPKPEAIQTPRKYEDQTAVVIDGCVLRVETAKKYLVKKESQDISTTLRRTFPQYLASQDAAPERVVAPFVCGVMNFDVKPVLIADKVMQDGDESPKEMTSLVSLDSGQDSVDEKEAYRQLLASIVSEPDKTYYDLGSGGLVGALISGAQTSREGTSIVYSKNMTLTQENANLLLQKLGVPRVWVVRFSGMDVSLGNKVAIGLLTLGGGSPMSSYNYDIALIDLRNVAVLWKGSARSIRARAPFYRAWDQNLFSKALASAPLKNAAQAVEVATPSH